MLSEKYDLDNLSRFLEGKPVPGFLSEYCFLNVDDYQAQTPELHPLGKLHYSGSVGRGGREEWLTEDNTIVVTIDRSGMVDGISEADPS